MEKIKWFRRRKKRPSSLKWSFIPYMLVMVAAAFLGLMAVGLGTNELQGWLSYNYSYSEPTRFETLMDDEGHSIRMLHNQVIWVDPVYRFLDGFANVAQFIVGTLWVVFCFGLPGLLFYKNKLKKPLAELMSAADKISDNNLDFSVSYESSDEMGALCASFEKMRSQLEENNLEMWRQMDERKRLNAAFSHDLRTPLTVLKGQSEMILKYAPDGRMSMEKLLSTVETMQRHIIRLEKYTENMNQLQRLEDIQIEKKEIALSQLTAGMADCAGAVCGKEKVFELDCMEPEKTVLFLDYEIFMQVFENLLSNGVRYVDKKISASLNLKDGLLYLEVLDDGRGFSDKMLDNAIKPFSSEAKGADEGGHFGIGLSICRILCEKHGGFIKVGNKNGGCVLAAFLVGEPAV